MKQGMAHKNLTDAILVIAAVIALVSVVVGVLFFESPTTITDPKTGEDVEIESPLEDPAVQINLKLFVTFTLAAAISFTARKWVLICIASSVASLVMAFNCFLDGTLEYMGYTYVVLAVIGLAGNIIHAVFVNEETKEQFKEALREQRSKTQREGAKKK